MPSSSRIISTSCPKITPSWDMKALVFDRPCARARPGGLLADVPLGVWDSCVGRLCSIPQGEDVIEYVLSLSEEMVKTEVSGPIVASSSESRGAIVELLLDLLEPVPAECVLAVPERLFRVPEPLTSRPRSRNHRQGQRFASSRFQYGV